MRITRNNCNYDSRKYKIFVLQKINRSLIRALRLKDIILSNIVFVRDTNTLNNIRRCQLCCHTNQDSALHAQAITL